MNKSQDLLYIEECFKNIKEKRNVESSLRSIERTLNRMYDLNIQISIVKNTSNKFFGMIIYPHNTTIDIMIKQIFDENNKTLDAVTNTWKENKNWYLEIDSLLLYDNNLNTNPAEMTAVLLHEIGHIVYSNSVPQRVNKVLKLQMLKLNFKLRTLCKQSVMSKLFGFCIIEACTNKSFQYTNPQSERAADMFVVKNGYSQELDNFITKLISTSGNSTVNKSDDEIDKEVEIVANWAVENITELEMRKTKLKLSIDVQMLKTPSIYVRNMLRDIRSIFINNDSTYKTMVREQFLINSHRKIINESLLGFFDKIGKMKKVTQMDIDLLDIEVDKITNNDDKIYVLDLIYEKIELVNTAYEMIESGQGDKVQQSKQSLIALKIQLEKMRDKVVGIKIKDRQYGLFIKYPVGFEG